MNDENGSNRPEDDAARLGLVVVGEAAALHSGDEAALDASEDNIRETVDDLVDEPLTQRQEEVVQRLASAGGTIAAGLSGALAAQTERSVDDVLAGAARAVVWQQRMTADQDRRVERDGTGDVAARVEQDDQTERDAHAEYDRDEHGDRGDRVDADLSDSDDRRQDGRHRDDR